MYCFGPFAKSGGVSSDKFEVEKILKKVVAGGGKADRVSGVDRVVG